MKLLGKCERCGASVVGNDYLCKVCRADLWETRYGENTCGNCRGRLEPGDKYCRLCGTKAGEGAFEPWQNIMQCVYGPMPVLRRHQCGACGHAWETEAMIDRQRYCPKCGHDTYADMNPSDPEENVVDVFGDRTSAILGLNRAGLISDDEAEQAIFGKGGQADDEAELDYPVILDLYEDNNPYEVNYHRVCIHEDAIEVDEVTVEKGPPDRYGLRHEVVGAYFVALKEALGADGPSLVEEVRRRFSGADGIRRLKDFCETNGIGMTTYVI